MKRFFTHPLFLSILTAVILYVVFGFALTPALPKSLLIQYMVICVIGILLVATFHDESAERMVQPISALFGDPNLAIIRMVALFLVIAGAGAITYQTVKPDLSSPNELRTVHPAPPSKLKVYGKNYNLLTLTNPLRDETEDGSEERTELVAEGGELYYKNCIFCHGDLLDGQGHLAQAFNPRPANFQDVGTIAQLQESYLFWRITTGGPGLPREGSPWASAMPVWHEMLSEEEVWKIIAFLYDYTGHVPRSWELEESSGKSTEDAGNADQNSALDEEAVDAIYMKRCSHCHGEDGEGDGPAAEFLYPLPRDFSLGVFKYKTTHADDEFPTDDDLRKTIKEGLPGTSMPGWRSLLSDAEIDGLIQKIKVLGFWDEEEIEHVAIDPETQIKSSPESIASGEKLFVKTCVQCHGKEGRGNITSGKRLKDDWQNRIWPRNLTRPSTWRATATVEEVFERISTGIRSTPMPEHTTTMKADDRWHISNYVMTLRGNSVPLSEGNTVVRAGRIEGDLPTDPNDPLWDSASAMTFRMSPNIIKEPRLFFSLNDMVTVRALFNQSEIALRLDVDDRTFSSPGSDLEKAYRLDGTEPTSDAFSVQFPIDIPVTSEKPWFRHGDKKHPVNIWYWAAQAEEPKKPAATYLMDATGPDAAPRPREDMSALNANGQWQNGRWQVVMKRALKTEDLSDLQFEEGKYIPISFANWDGLNSEKGGRHSFTGWYWLLLEPEENLTLLYGGPAGAGLIAGFIFLVAARRQRKKRERSTQ